MTALETLVRMCARRTTQNGQVVLITNGHPALLTAFHELGWSDPYPDPELLEQPLSKPDTPARGPIITPSSKGSGQ